MGSLLPGWNAAAEAPSPTRRWSDTVRRQDLETLRREERRHREARARLSAAAARADDAVARLRAGAARASSPGPPFAGTPPVGSRRREDEEDEEDEAPDAVEDLLREMRLGAWHRLLSDARRSLEPEPGDGELSVDSAVVSGVAAALNADSASFGDARRATRALDALALERSGGRFFFDGERNRGSFGHAETTTRDDDRGSAFALRTEHVAEGKTPRVRVRLEVVDDDGSGEEEEEEEKNKKEPVFSGDADRESFVRVVEEARRRRAAAAAAAAAAARPSGWWDRTESAHLNRDVSREG